jgi:hypothetical protein
MSAIEVGLGTTALKIGAAVTVLTAEFIVALALLVVAFG